MRVRIAIIGVLLAIFCCGCGAAVRRCEIEAATFERVSKARSLTFQAPVECALATPRAARIFIRDALNRDQLRVQLEGETLKLLGVISPLENYYSLLLDSYATRISGYYDRKKKNLMVSTDSSPLTRRVVANHELVHALQDQHFDLEKLLDEELTSDAKLARQALMEGDANLISFLLASGDALNGGSSVCRRFSGEALPLLLELRKGSISLQDSVALRLIMDFPYLYGVAFACAITAGTDFSQLNPYFLTPPASTKEMTDRLTLLENSGGYQNCLSGRATVSKGVLIDSFGYFFVIGMLAEEFPVSTAFRVTKDFVCDELYYDNGKLKWQMHWASEQAANDFASLYREWWLARLRDRQLKTSRILSITVSGKSTEISNIK